MTMLRLYDGDCMEPCEAQAGDLVAHLAAIEKVGENQHRMVFILPPTQIEAGGCAMIKSRLAFTTEALSALLTLIPKYLAMCEGGNNEQAQPQLVFDDKVIQFKKRQPVAQLR